MAGPSELDAIALRRGGLRFVDPRVEADYRAWHLERAIPFVRVGLIASALAWTTALAVGFAVMPPGSLRPAALWIVGVLLPLAAASFVLTERPRLARWVLPAVALDVAVAGILAVGLAFAYGLPEMAMVGAITLVFFGFTVVRLHLLEATLATAPCVVLHEAILGARLDAGAIDAATFGIHTLAVVSAMVTAALACAALDRVSRDGFRRERIIAAQTVTIAAERARADLAERARQLADALLRLTGAIGRASELGPGDVVEDRYRVIRAIGRGGMGRVHEVERLTDGRRLALKVLTGEVHRLALARFAREAQIAAQLDHPHVVAVLDVGVSQSGLLFLVMELVDGGSLADARRDRDGDAAWAVARLAEIADALAAMHARGIVHRDLKPANVLVGARGAQVAEFGLASLADPDGSEDPTASTMAPSGLTHTGAVMGTPRYMAPELTRGARDAQPSADVWSFGVLAHELLDGAPPFDEPPVLARLAGRATGAPRPLAAPALPEALRALLDACLALDASARPTAAALRDALAAHRLR